MEKKEGLNKNYGRNFGLGMITALLFVLLVFNWTFPAKGNQVLTTNMVSLDDDIMRTPPKVLENEKKKKARDVSIIKDTKKLVDDVKFSDDLTADAPDTHQKGVTVDSTLTQPIGKPTIKKVPKQAKRIEKKRKEPVNDIVSVAEEMPRFGDCETAGRGRLDDCSTKKLLRFIADNVKYPQLAREIGQVGRVIAQFIVEKDGHVSSVEILKDPGTGLGEEAKRVLELLPTWKPGRQMGKPVRVRYVIPVVFKLD